MLLHSILLFHCLSSHLCTMLPALQACRKRLDHCPCQPKTGPVSSRHIHMSIAYTPLLTSSLVTVPSRMFRMCGFFSSSTTVFRLGRPFGIEMRWVGNICTSECYAPLDSLVCLEWNCFLTQVFDLLSTCCHKLLRCRFRTSLTRGNIVSGITWPAGRLLDCPSSPSSCSAC